MMGVQTADILRTLPEIILSVFAILVMVSDPFTSAERKRWLGWLSLVGVVVAAIGAIWTSLSPGLAFGGHLAADDFSLYFIFIILLVAALTILGSMHYLERDHIHHGEYYALILMASVGACFMAASTELIMIFIGLEVSSLSTYILAGFRRTDARSNEASLKYFLLGSFATAFFLYGIAFVYGLTGTTRLVELNERLTHGDPSAQSSFLWVAAILMFIGLAFKVSSAPFQIWTPDVYEGAPAPVTAFLSTAPKAAAFAILLRIFLGGLASAETVVFWVIWLSALLTMCVGNLAALWQSNVKRLLAYSSIAHAGYVLVGVAAALAGGQSEGTASVIFYLLAYALMNVGIFVLVAYLAGTGERWTNAEDYTGLGYKHPGIAACLTVFLLSLAGLPSTAGFFAKFYVFRAAVHAHLIGLTVVAVLNSVVSVYYYFRIIVAMYMREGEPEPSLSATPATLRAAFTISLLGIFYLGLFPGLFLNLANSAAFPLP